MKTRMIKQYTCGDCSQDFEAKGTKLQKCPLCLELHVRSYRTRYWKNFSLKERLRITTSPVGLRPRQVASFARLDAAREVAVV